MSVQSDIEVWLLLQETWVSAREICIRFGVEERALRASGEKMGLCSCFAISGDKGFKHVRCASDPEFDQFVSRLRAHGIGELHRVKILKIIRATARTSPPLIEKFTGQVLLGV